MPKFSVPENGFVGLGIETDRVKRHIRRHDLCFRTHGNGNDIQHRIEKEHQEEDHEGIVADREEFLSA